MIYKSESGNTQAERLMQWHSWFAFFPVRIGEHKVWLEFVERRAKEASWDGYGGIIWEYKFAHLLSA